jgi:hypothetical protein
MYAVQDLKWGSGGPPQLTGSHETTLEHMTRHAMCNEVNRMFHATRGDIMAVPAGSTCNWITMTPNDEAYPEVAAAWQAISSGGGREYIANLGAIYKTSGLTFVEFLTALSVCFHSGSKKMLKNRFPGYQGSDAGKYRCSADFLKPVAPLAACHKIPQQRFFATTYGIQVNNKAPSAHATSLSAS